MGKRTSEKTDDEIRNKIRRLEKELKSRQKPPDDSGKKGSESNSCDEYEEIEYDAYNYDDGSGNVNEEEAVSESHRPKSVIEMPTPASPSLVAENIIPEESSDGVRVHSPSRNEESMLPPEILAALGEAKTSEEIFGQKIPMEVAERWGKILIEGLRKEQKENLLTKILIPENFQLAKAPRLNAEVVSVINESTKNRDRRLEKMQNQLGCGIAGLAHLTSELISKEMSKFDIIKQISEINQILLDLHYEETMNRRRLIIPMLDKSFINVIQGIKREKFLFGDNLTENIKTTKSIEKSSLQIKKSQLSAPRKPMVTGAQGNLKAPPRQPSGQGAARATHAQARYYPPPQQPAARRQPPATRRPPPPPPPTNRPQNYRGRR